METTLQTLRRYKTAFCPMFNCFVSIDRVFNDDREEPILVCSNASKGLNGHLFRTYELRDFVL